jgi:hypothetical protein
VNPAPEPKPEPGSQQARHDEREDEVESDGAEPEPDRPVGREERKDAVLQADRREVVRDTGHDVRRDEGNGEQCQVAM